MLRSFDCDLSQQGNDTMLQSKDFDHLIVSKIIWSLMPSIILFLIVVSGLLILQWHLFQVTIRKCQDNEM